MIEVCRVERDQEAAPRKGDDDDDDDKAVVVAEVETMLLLLLLVEQRCGEVGGLATTTGLDMMSLMMGSESLPVPAASWCLYDW